MDKYRFNLLNDGVANACVFEDSVSVAKVSLSKYKSLVNLLVTWMVKTSQDLNAAQTGKAWNFSPLHPRQ